ncbi:hypothetical protein L1887_44536 [Cichorium endivia]|nr:hypothetical protein L1887_44536 [Cichorium endivia]
MSRLTPVSMSTSAVQSRTAVKGEVSRCVRWNASCWVEERDADFRERRGSCHSARTRHADTLLTAPQLSYRHTTIARQSDASTIPRPLAVLSPHPSTTTRSLVFHHVVRGEYGVWGAFAAGARRLASRAELAAGDEPRVVPLLLQHARDAQPPGAPADRRRDAGCYARRSALAHAVPARPLPGRLQPLASRALRSPHHRQRGCAQDHRRQLGRSSGPTESLLDVPALFRAQAAGPGYGARVGGIRLQRRCESSG